MSGQRCTLTIFLGFGCSCWTLAQRGNLGDSSPSSSSRQIAQSCSWVLSPSDGESAAANRWHSSVGVFGRHRIAAFKASTSWLRSRTSRTVGALTHGHRVGWVGYPSGQSRRHPNMLTAANGQHASGQLRGLHVVGTGRQGLTVDPHGTGIDVPACGARGRGDL